MIRCCGEREAFCILAGRSQFSESVLLDWTSQVLQSSLLHQVEQDVSSGLELGIFSSPALVSSDIFPAD